jgi:hypothetical protein
MQQLEQRDSTPLRAVEINESTRTFHRTNVLQPFVFKAHRKADAKAVRYPLHYWKLNKTTHVCDKTTQGQLDRCLKFASIISFCYIHHHLIPTLGRPDLAIVNARHANCRIAEYHVWSSYRLAGIKVRETSCAWEYRIWTVSTRIRISFFGNRIGANGACYETIDIRRRRQCPLVCKPSHIQVYDMIY